MMKKLIPRESILPIAVTVLMNVLAYYGTRLIPNRDYISVATYVDTLVPFVPGMIYIYVLAYVSWALGLWLVSNDTPERSSRLFFAEQLATFIAMLFFVLLPSKMERPAVEGPNTLTLWLVRLIYSIDAPNNLFPSLHCVENWILFRAVQGNQKVPNWAKAFFGVFALLVFASVVMVKQHLALDVVGAVAVVELSLAIAKATHAERFYMGLNRRILH